MTILNPRFYDIYYKHRFHAAVGGFKPLTIEQFLLLANKLAQ